MFSIVLTCGQKVMRFRRTIIASLAPLIGLSAILAAATAEAGTTGGARPLIRLLQTVAQLAAPACDYAATAASHDRPPAQALLAFTALSATPFAHSVWMIVTPPAVDLLTRTHLSVPLRC